MRRASVVACAAAIAAVLVGCAIEPVTEAKPGNEVGVGAGLPESVSVTLQQTREDIGQRKLEIRVTNGSSELLMISGMTFSAPQFVGPMRWQKTSTTISTGAAADLTVELVEPVCDVDVFSGVVVLDFERKDGSRGTARIDALDEFDRLPIIRQSDCFVEAVDDRLTIKPAVNLRILTVGTRLIAQLDLELTPTSRAGASRSTLPGARCPSPWPRRPPENFSIRMLWV